MIPLQVIKKCQNFLPKPLPYILQQFGKRISASNESKSNKVREPYNYVNMASLLILKGFGSYFNR